MWDFADTTNERADLGQIFHLEESSEFHDTQNDGCHSG